MVRGFLRKRLGAPQFEVNQKTVLAGTSIGVAVNAGVGVPTVHAQAGAGTGAGGCSGGSGTGGPGSGSGPGCEGSGSSGGCAGCEGGPGTSSAGVPFSTPFLRTWNGERFVYENDFLLGTPSTFVNDARRGRSLYEAGGTGGDLYRILNKCVENDGKLSFQITEVEPEESYIDFISLRRVMYPKGGTLIVNANHRVIHVFRTDAIHTNGKITDQRAALNNRVLPPSVSEAKDITGEGESKVEHVLSVGDILTLEGKVASVENSLLLLIGSRYRDWTAGEIPTPGTLWSGKKVSELLGETFARSPRGFARAGALLLFAALVWISGIAGNVVEKALALRAGSNSDGQLSLAHFSPPRAHASHPTGGHSLLVEFWDWALHAFRLAQVVQPRHRQTSLEAVSLPAEAVRSDGGVRIRVTATKRHNINLLSLFAPSKEEELKSDTEVLALKRVYHHRLQRNVTERVKTAFSGEYLHTVAGDTVDIDFEAPKNKCKKGMQAGYVLEARGFFAPLSVEGARVAGNWVERLDDESKDWMREMYALGDYHKENRRPVLVS